MSSQIALPYEDAVGCGGEWALPMGPDRDDIVFGGRYLGMSSSRRERHNHGSTAYVGPGGRCSACRWTESRIFLSTADGRYLIHTVGISRVPGETDRFKARWVLTAYEVVSYFVQRPEGGGRPFLTNPADMVLAQAAGHDDDLRDAYENRAVA